MDDRSALTAAAAETARVAPVPAWYVAHQSAVDHAITTSAAEIRADCGQHSQLAEAVMYSLGSGGKRVRPVLVLECARLCGVTTAPAASSSAMVTAALPTAVAIECIHAFSLIHDDLPAMDDDDLRRGEPTNHKVFGEALAILAGDYLQSFAARCVLRPAVRAAERAAVLAQATAAMIAGQAADIAGEGQPASAARVAYIHHNKTGALIEAACRLGALTTAAPDELVERIAGYGRHLGLAFQIADDLLDVTGSEAATGKRTGKDALVEKQTYPAVFGVEASRQRAADEVASAIAALEPIGPAADPLRELARYVILRDR